MLTQYGFHQTDTRAALAGATFSLLPESSKRSDAPDDAALEEAPELDGGADDSLEDAASKEREYMRERLRAELRRDPTEEELNDWLRRHTEGY